MKNHSFDIEVAKAYGVNAAILFQNICFWCEKNRANDVNFHDGMYWTFNTRKAFRELFPYMSEKQIKAALDNLIEDGLIVTGTYNKDARDRTLWYAVTKRGFCIFQNGNLETSEKSNADAEKVSALPDIKQTDINTDIETDDEESACACEDDNPFAESDARPSTDTVYAYASQELHSLGYRAIQELQSFVDDTSEEVVRHAIDNALDNGVRKWAYVKAILNEYVDNHVKTFGDAKRIDEEYKRRKKGGVSDGAERFSDDKEFCDRVFGHSDF